MELLNTVSVSGENAEKAEWQCSEINGVAFTLPLLPIFVDGAFTDALLVNG